MPKLCLILTIMFSLGFACADEIVTAGKTLSDARIIDFTNGNLLIRHDKKIVRMPLAQVQRLKLDSEPLLNQAEELLAAGKGPQAVTVYRQALKASKGRWHIALAKARLDAAVKRYPDVPEDSAGQAVPSHQNSVMVPKGTPKTSLDALGEDLATVPDDPREGQNWKGLDQEDQTETMKKYQAALEKWKKAHDYHGFKIAWTMKLTGEASGSGYIVSGKSSRGFYMKAEVDHIEPALLEAMNAGQQMLVEGSIREYTVQVDRSDSIFSIELVRLGVIVEKASLSLAGASAVATSQPASAASKPAKN